MKSLSISCFLAAVMTATLFGSDFELVSQVKLKDIKHPDQISAVATLEGGKFLVVGVDEGVDVQVLRKADGNEYELHKKIPLVDFDTKDEIDIEGIARHKSTFYVIGSHSRKRSKVEPTEEKREENRERLTRNKVEPLRETLFRFKLDSDGKLDSDVEMTSLRKRIDEDVILKPFAQIPSKENGVDIEGIAANEDQLYVAFRGPVLRDGYVPVLVFDFDKPNKADMLFVNLDGRGVRDIVRANDGFLLIGGPMGDAPVSFELYHWDGEDGIPGTDVTPIKPKSLGRIPLPNEEAKAEGVTVLAEDGTHYEVLIVYDGVKEENATRYRVKKKD
jgi:hypothetical protein